MSRPYDPTDSLLGRACALFLATLLVLAGCPGGVKPLQAMSGVREYQAPSFVRIPGGVVNVAGGNFHVRRVDLSIDTRLGSRAVGAVYDSKAGTWHWSFDMSSDGATFVDESRAVFDISELAAGDPIPGTHWVKVSTSQIKTKGGLLYAFDPTTGRLDHLRWTSALYPRLVFLQGQVAGAPHTVQVDQCATASSGCSLVYQVSYDAAARVVGLSDRAGRSTSYAYDAAGLLIQARDAFDVEQALPGFRYEYSGTLLSAVTNSEGERIEYGYAGRRLREARPIGAPNPVYRFVYGGKSDGLYTTRAIDSTGDEIRYRFDASYRLHEKEVVATGEVSRLVWVGERPVQFTDPAGVVTSRTWLDDDLATETQPSGNVVTFTYDAGGESREAPLRRPLLQVQDSIGGVEQRAYDASGRLISVANGAGDITTFTYDAENMLAIRTGPSGVVTTFAGYGEAGHATTLTTGGIAAERSFDAVGNLVQGSPDAQPERPGVWTRAYDGDRNLSSLVMVDSSVIGPLTSATITIERRSDGRVAAIRRPGGGDHEFLYDALGRPVEVRERVDGVWSAATTEYDAAGRVTATQLANGMRREVTYSAAGRLASLRLMRSGVVEGTASFTYAAGRLATLTDSTLGGVESNVYDGAGRLAAVTYADGETLQLSYDLRSRKVAETYLLPGGQLLRSLSFDYDAADRPTTTTDQGQVVLQHTRETGKLATVSYGNGLTRSFSHDAATGLLVGTTTLDAAGQTLESTIVAHGATLNGFAVGVSATTTTTSGGVIWSTEEEHSLTPVEVSSNPMSFSGRRVVYWTDGEPPATVESFSYDPLGNRTDSGFLYNTEANRLLSADVQGSGLVDYTYDESGFVISRAGVPLSWTAGGKLASLGTELSFQWDVLGRMVELTHQGVTSQFRFGGRVQGDASGTPLLLDLGEVQIQLGSGTHLYRHFDFRDNVKFVTDDQGQVLAHYLYDPYGVRQVLGSDADSVRFVGRVEVAGLMILGARIYDPLIGRFLSPDPILNLVNQYAYVLGNPVFFSDPNGTELGLVAGGIGLGALGGIAAALAPAMAAALAEAGLGTILAGILAAFPGVLLALLAALLLTAALENAAMDSPTSSPSGRSGAGTSSGGGGSPGGGGGPGGGGSGGCSPVAISRAPDLGWLLGFLVPLQLVLAALLFGRRRRR